MAQSTITNPDLDGRRAEMLAELGTTANSCPGWCTADAGHPYESVTLDGKRHVRYHVRTVGTVGLPNGRTLIVDITAEETADRDTGGNVTLAEPVIDTYGEVREVGAELARQLAELLTTAAYRLDFLDDLG